jgi:iron complex transport system permease protein
VRRLDAALVPTQTLAFIQSGVEPPHSKVLKGSRAMAHPSLHRRIAALAILAALLAAIAVGSLGFGQVRIGWGEVVSILAGRADEAAQADPARAMEVKIIRNVRLPRIALAILVGGALAAAGMAMQALFQNPLADPYIVGVAPGAAAGATFAIALGLGESVLGEHTLPVSAFAGSLIVSFLVYVLASRFGRVPVLHLLLFGVAIGALCTGLTSFILMVSPEHVQEVYFWLLGTFQNANLSKVRILWPYVLAGVVVLFFFARDMDALLLGEDEAEALGVPVERVKRILLAVATLLAAVAVAVSGIIGFVGLIVPHMMRLVVGPRHRMLLPASFLAGGALMVTSDTLARSIRAGTEIPVGIITTFLGVPFFLFLLSRRGRLRIKS